MLNAQAIKLPDPLLVRYYREDKIERIKKVAQNARTKAVTVTLLDGTIEKWKHVSDWLPDID